jgi:hypothetical protein
MSIDELVAAVARTRIYAHAPHSKLTEPGDQNHCIPIGSQGQEFNLSDLLPLPKQGIL